MIENTIRRSILLTLALVLIAQMLYIPVVTSLVFLVIWLFLLLNTRASKKPFSKILTYVLTLIALFSIYISHKTFIGVDAGVTVLSTFLFAKSLETKTRRDVIILFNFAMFVIASSFLFSQSFAMALVILLALLSCFIGLYRLQTVGFRQNSGGEIQAIKQDIGHVGKFIALAVPFFILLFLFFPRLPPLWHIPIPENKATTGISDSMSPGDIAELSQSSSLAFRIIGDIQALPTRTELYWRAMALDEYDGSKWTSHFFNQNVIQLNPADLKPKRTLNYQYLAADPTVMWIMSLEQSVPNEARFALGQDGRITPYRLTARTEPIQLKWLGSAEPPQIKNVALLEKLNTRYVENLDVQSQQLAQTLWQRSRQNPERYIAEVLQWYKQNRFAYTLSPGVLGQNRIDDFLFGSRQGFCEHFASSFAMLMRYVGVPSRIVVGYQGGQLAPDGKSWEVRQLDAHAWTEVYVNQHWRRIDPTAMIAPQRIDGGMQDYMEQDRTIFGRQQSTWAYQQISMLKKVRVWSDYASYQWQSKVVGYNAESQQQWFKKLGTNSAYAGVLILILSIGGIVALYFIWILWKKRKSLSSLEREIAKFAKNLPLSQQKVASESFRHWLQRLAENVPEQERAAFEQVITLFEQEIYVGTALSSHDIQYFKALLKTCTQSLKKSEKGLS
ncbi:DUF3488 and transglutaminase-like domain-containing protein [Acinetobacter sp. YH12054]|uniref:transglutaminase family protein n=1 Tax=Acinetobacter sp. YH12054 TaxID=2601056 RepID=UPI0015D1A5B2|nr:DUF3488 and transglutaminase-like domain-containing protein [Acinetobacter sp. YH12054]